MARVNGSILIDFYMSGKKSEFHFLSDKVIMLLY